MEFVKKIEEIRRVRWGSSVVLAGWSVWSVVVGVGIWLAGGQVGGGVGALAGAVGMQFVIWGLIDLVFAGMGLRQAVVAGRVAAEKLSAAAAELEMNEARKVLKIVRFNHWLNLSYLLVGVGLVVWGMMVGVGSEGGSEARASLLGHGAGVLIQGGFLTVFDKTLAGRLGRLV